MSHTNIDEHRSYRRVYDLARYHAVRKAWFDANGPCVKCGSWDNLELDHKDRSTKVKRGDSSVWTWSEARRQTEIAKCQVLCKPCHVLKTHQDLYKPKRHGTTTMYRIGCRCRLCVDEQNAYRRAWRARRKGLGRSD